MKIKVLCEMHRCISFVVLQKVILILNSGYKNQNWSITFQKQPLLQLQKIAQLFQRDTSQLLNHANKLKNGWKTDKMTD